MNGIMKKVLNGLLVVYTFIVWGSTLSLGMTIMMHAKVDFLNLSIVGVLWVLLFVWVQYLIREMN